MEDKQKKPAQRTETPQPRQQEQKSPDTDGQFGTSFAQTNPPPTQE